MAISASNSAIFRAQIAYDDEYVQPLILKALENRLPSNSYILQDSKTETDQVSPTTPLSLPSPLPLLQILPYESLAFEKALASPHKMLINAYVIRKALIRKHFLALTVESWIKKSPASILKSNVPPSYEFELDYAEFLDDALLEMYELKESLELNQALNPESQQWWILKPSMSDRGQGIRIFSTLSHLTSIFEEWEVDTDEEPEQSDNNIPTSDLRHFVVQPYLHTPLLLQSPDGTNLPKFHVRTYVIAVGALKVYVYRPMLALFAAQEYLPPWSDDSLERHLTNTCIQGVNATEASVQQFWSLEGNDWKEHVFEQICKVSGELFEGASRTMTIHFQTIPCSFEIFGLDFLIDSDRTAWLLEVNAFPDFKQTGPELQHLIQGLWEGTIDIAVKPFFNIAQDNAVDNNKLVKVLDIDLGRR